MSEMNYEACYAALQLNFGAGLKEVNERWRKLSREHHPDRHVRDPRAYRQALEKQKQLNNARDVLKKWFETNPSTPPPKTQRSSTQNNSQGSTAGARSTHNEQTAGQSQSTSNNSQHDSNQSHKSHSQTHSHQHHWESRSHSHSGSSSHQREPDPPTGWFKPSDLNLSPLQALLLKVDAYCNRPHSDSATGMAIALEFAAVFGPLWFLSAILGLIFPDLPGHYPEWLSMLLLFGSGFVTTYIFRWYFAEVAIIKLQQRALTFSTDRTIPNSIDFLKLVIGKQTRPNAQWKFVSNGSTHEAILEFDEEVLPEIKRPRRLLLRFEARKAATGSVVRLELRAKSPINSFSCRHIADAVVCELKKEFNQLAA